MRGKAGLRLSLGLAVLLGLTGAAPVEHYALRKGLNINSFTRSGRVAASILWALATTHPDSLRVTNRTFDERLGSTALREAIQHGADPDSALAREQPAVDTFLRHAERFRLYR